MAFELETAKVLGYLSVQLVSKIFMLGYVVLSHQRYRRTDGRTDRRMDDMQSQYRAMHFNASRGKNFLMF